MSLNISKYIYRKLRSFEFITNLTKSFTTKYATNSSIKSNLKSDKSYTLNENSLEKRLITYLKVSQPVNSTNIGFNINNYSSEEISTITNDKLLCLVYKLSEVVTRSNLQKCVKNLDLECRKRLPEMKNGEIFQFLLGFVNTVPHLIRFLLFYTQAINKISFTIEFCSNTELVQLCFYTGLQKKTVESQQIIKQCLNKLNNSALDNLALEDIIILCNAAFKTSTRISQRKILNEIKYRIFNQLSILNDESFFITIVKSLRHNYNYDEELLLTITNTMFFNKTLQKYNFTAISHILALYADALYYDEILLHVLNDKCINYLQNAKSIVTETEHFSVQVRLKDISRYIWALSYLGYDLKNESIENYVVPILKDFINLGVYEKIEEFIGILLSLWIMGYNSQELLQPIFKNKALFNGKKHRKSFTTRLSLLLTSIKFEREDIFSILSVTPEPSPLYKADAQITQRPHLAKIYKSLQKLSQKHNIASLEYDFRIPHLNIVGITGYDKDKNENLFIECVDNMTSIKNTDYNPHGFMKLKLRLLKTLNKPILVIAQDEIGELSQEEIEKLLNGKLRRLLT